MTTSPKIPRTLREDAREYTIDLEGHDSLTLLNLPGTFSREKPDPGSRFLLESLVSLKESYHPLGIVDPGCGNGILGLAAARIWPEARITCTDDSSLAVYSARLSAEENSLTAQIDCIQTDILEGIPDNSADLIVCNPPFHQSRRISMTLPFRFISESARVLRRSGLFLLVANRHLGYMNTLKKNYANVEIAAENKKYRIYSCTARRNT